MRIDILITGHVTPDNLPVAVEQPFREFLTPQAKLRSGDSYQYKPSRYPLKRDYLMFPNIYPINL